MAFFLISGYPLMPERKIVVENESVSASLIVFFSVLLEISRNHEISGVVAVSAAVLRRLVLKADPLKALART